MPHPILTYTDYKRAHHVGRKFRANSLLSDCLLLAEIDHNEGPGTHLQGVCQQTLPLTCFSPNQLRERKSAVCINCAPLAPNPVNAARANGRDTLFATYNEK
eukprot:gene11689-biopygen1455